MTERPLTPRMLAVLRAIVELRDESHPRPSANLIARRAAAYDPAILEPVRRHGRGAVKYSWSGTAADCQRILGPLGALRARGLVYVEHPPHDGVRLHTWSLYWPMPEGRRVLAASIEG